MTKHEAVKEFNSFLLPIIEHMEVHQNNGKENNPLREEQWESFLVMLRKQGRINETQQEKWKHLYT
jgi:hypothetical protein